MFIIRLRALIILTPNVNAQDQYLNSKSVIS
mgnify:CR=1 FL=1